jgi:hypothetical protein
MLMKEYSIFINLGVVSFTDDSEWNLLKMISALKVIWDLHK